MVSTIILFLFILPIHLVQRGALLSNLHQLSASLPISLNLLIHLQFLHLPLFLLTCQIPMLCLHHQHSIVFNHPCQPHLVVLLRILFHNLQTDYINCLIQRSIVNKLSNFQSFLYSKIFTVLQRHGCLILYVTLKFSLQISQR